MSFILRDSHCCAYCGQPASTRDHVTPASWSGTRGRDGSSYKSPWNTIPACRRCNSWLYDKHPGDLAARADEIASMLMRKNTKLLNQPAWSDEEIAGMGPRMQQYIQGRINLKLQLHSDIAHASAVARTGARLASDYWALYDNPDTKKGPLPGPPEAMWHAGAF